MKSFDFPITIFHLEKQPCVIQRSFHWKWTPLPFLAQTWLALVKRNGNVPLKFALDRVSVWWEYLYDDGTTVFFVVVLIVVEWLCKSFIETLRRVEDMSLDFFPNTHLTTDECQILWSKHFPGGNSCTFLFFRLPSIFSSLELFSLPARLSLSLQKKWNKTMANEREQEGKKENRSNSFLFSFFLQSAHTDVCVYKK